MEQITSIPEAPSCDCYLQQDNRDANRMQAPHRHHYLRHTSFPCARLSMCLYHRLTERQLSRVLRCTIVVIHKALAWFTHHFGLRAHQSHVPRAVNIYQGHTSSLRELSQDSQLSSDYSTYETPRCECVRSSPLIAPSGPDPPLALRYHHMLHAADI